MKRARVDTGHQRGSLMLQLFSNPTLVSNCESLSQPHWHFLTRPALAAAPGNTQTQENILWVSARNCLRPRWLPMTCGGSWFRLRAWQLWIIGRPALNPLWKKEHVLSAQVVIRKCQGLDSLNYRNVFSPCSGNRKSRFYQGWFLAIV